MFVFVAILEIRWHAAAAAPGNSLSNLFLRATYWLSFVARVILVIEDREGAL